MIDIIIEELDKQGINLQETKLNLINQGYKWYWDFWVQQIYERAIRGLSFEIAQKSLRKIFDRKEKDVCECCGRKY